MRGGSIVDATLISVPSSIKNAEKKRDPEMHQTKKGNPCHTGVDAGRGFIHRVEATAANIHDISVTAKLLREANEVVYGDSAYLGLKKREVIQQDPHLSATEYRINLRPGRLPIISDKAIDWEWHIENYISAVSCKLEHPYRIVKNIFGLRKTVCRGLRKNATDYTCALPVQICIFFPGRTVHYAPSELSAPFRPDGRGKMEVFPPIRSYTLIFLSNSIVPFSLLISLNSVFRHSP